MTEYICIPFNRALYNDIVRFSDGRLDPASLAEDQVTDLIERNLDHLAFDWFGDRLIEFVRIHFPHHVERIEAESGARETEAPLRWKELQGAAAVPSGTLVRMHYKNSWHHACVRNGKIEDDDGRFSPSEWANKIGRGVSLNAWLYLEFRAAYGGDWKRANDLRSKARKAQQEWEKTINVKLF